MEAQQLAAPQPLVEGEVLGQVADAGAGPRRADRRAEQPPAARGRVDEAEQHLDRGRLARPVRAQEAEDLTPRHGQGEVPDRDLGAEVLAERLGLEGGLGHGYRIDCAISRSSTPSRVPGPWSAKTLSAVDHSRSACRRAGREAPSGAVRAGGWTVTSRPFWPGHLDLAERPALDRHRHEERRAPVDRAGEAERLLGAHAGDAQAEPAERREVEALRQLHLRGRRLEEDEAVLARGPAVADVDRARVAHRQDRRHLDVDRRAVPPRGDLDLVRPRGEGERLELGGVDLHAEGAGPAERRLGRAPCGAAARSAAGR